MLPHDFEHAIPDPDLEHLGDPGLVRLVPEVEAELVRHDLADPVRRLRARAKRAFADGLLDGLQVLQIDGLQGIGPFPGDRDADAVGRPICMSVTEVDRGELEPRRNIRGWSQVGFAVVAAEVNTSVLHPCSVPSTRTQIGGLNFDQRNSAKMRRITGSDRGPRPRW